MRISKEMQLWFSGPMTMLWLGIYFTGFGQVDIFIYIPAVMSVFAFLTGLCPGMMIIRTLSAKKKTDRGI